MHKEMSEDEIDIREIFSVLGKHKKKILFFAVLFAMLAAGYAYITPNVYSTYTTLEIGETKSKGISGSEDILAMAMSSGMTNTDTEMEIIKSKYLIERVLHNVDFRYRYYIKKNYRERELYSRSPLKVGLRKGKGISFLIHPVNTRYYKLEAKGIDLETFEAWRVENVYQYDKPVHEEHFDLTLHLKKEVELDKDATYRFIVLEQEDAIEEIQKKLSVAQTTKQSTILKITLNDNIPLRARQFVDALAKEYLKQEIERKTEEASKILAFIDKQLSGIDVNLQDSEKKLENFKKQSNMMSLGTKAEGVVSSMSEYESKLAQINIKSKMLDTLYAQIKNGKNFESISAAGLDLSETGIPKLIQGLHDVVLKRKVLLADYTESHPEVKKLTESIVQTKKIITSAIETLKVRVSKRKILLEKTIKEYEALMEALPEKEKIFGGLQRKFVVNEKIYSYLLEKRATTAIAKASTVSRSRILDKARIATKPTKPKRTLIILVGVIVGLIFGIMLAFVREFMDDKIKTEDDVRKITDLALLGTIPHIKNDKGSISIFDAPKSIASEAFRALRANLQFIQTADESMLISVTSTISGEGKTTVSVNLAAIISLTGKKTIVLNMDMRRPTLHKKFALSNEQGMSTVLSGKATLEDAIQHSEHENLDMIASGPIPPNPSELANSKEMLEVIEKLKEEYDVIIMDTPPLGLVADAVSLMRMSDVTLYVLRSAYSKKIYVEDMQHRIEKHEIKSLSLLLNDVKEEGKGYGYGYGDGYGYYDNN